MIPPPMNRLRLSAVPEYVRSKGIEVTRQTVYNWRNKGVRGRYLHTFTRAGTLYTTKGQVNDFLSGLN